MLRKITIYLEDAEPLPEGIRGATSCEKLTEEKETYYMMMNRKRHLCTSAGIYTEVIS